MPRNDRPKQKLETKWNRLKHSTSLLHGNESIWTDYPVVLILKFCPWIVRNLPRTYSVTFKKPCYLKNRPATISLLVAMPRFRGQNRKLFLSRCLVNDYAKLVRAKTPNNSSAILSYALPASISISNFPRLICLPLKNILAIHFSVSLHQLTPLYWDE
jgi:hypothetical protein